MATILIVNRIFRSCL